ncbi:hypothetical protein ACFVQ4_34205 [Streptomyces laurentii]
MRFDGGVLGRIGLVFPAVLIGPGPQRARPAVDFGTEQNGPAG